jgi:hypothetical protein
MQKMVMMLSYIIAILISLSTTSFAYEIIAVTSLTGPLSPIYQKYDKYLIDGVRIAVQEQNSRGGINGQKINFFYYDDEGRPERAAQVAKRIVNVHKNILGIVGHSSSSTTLAALPIYASKNIPILVPIAQAPQITQMGYNNVFRFSGRVDWMVKYLAVNSLRELNKKNFAIIYPQNDKQYYNYFREALPDNAKVVYESPMSEIAVAAACKAIKKYGEEVGLVILYPFRKSANYEERLYRMKKIFNDIYPSCRLTRLFLTSYEYDDVSIFQKFSKEVDGHNYIITSVEAENYPDGREFIKKYGIKNNFGFFSYICGQIFFKAILNSKASNGNPSSKLTNLDRGEYLIGNTQILTHENELIYSKVKYKFELSAIKPTINTLKKTSFRTGVGNIKFNSNGDALWAPYAMYTVYSGEVQTVAFDGTGGNGCCPEYDFCCDSLE